MAVYTTVNETTLDSLLERYDIGKRLALTGITKGVENTNYKLVTDKGAFILTIYEKRVDPDDLPFFLNLKKHLAEQGYPCPTPIADREGRILQQLEGKPMALVRFLEGESVTIPTIDKCRKAGATLARLHQAGTGFPMHRDNALCQGTWRALFARCREVADQMEPGLTKRIDAWLDDIEQNWPSNLPAGVIHADLFPDNVLFHRNQVSGVIDFYFACNDYYAYDLGIMINAWCFDTPDRLNRDKAAALITGYAASRPLTEAEWLALPILAQGAAMRFFLTRLYDWVNTPDDAQVERHDPADFLARLVAHDGITTASQYGTPCVNA